ncbi:MAG: Uma2 family endonuclease [Chloroflexi bacterium]|nr:Uma2 family endonuclease [Chloroflexota bacterium]
MSVQAPVAETAIVYPESDGKPIAENTKQFRWIVTIEGGLEALFRDDPNVFVAGDLLWYPVEGRPDVCTAPDAMVVFGRPKGDRRSYLQWQEDGIPPQVVFEVLSPGNTYAEMVRKFQFNERYGVEEYYVYDPDRGELSGWQRRGGALEEIDSMQGWVSPRLGVRFELGPNGDLALYRPDGERFASYVELIAQREQAHRRAEEEHARAEQERRRAERLAAQLRALGLTPDDAE